MANAYDLIVIGGGLVGGAIAWGAARVAHPSPCSTKATSPTAPRAAISAWCWVQSKGAGMPPYAHWTRRSAELWPDLAGALAEPPAWTSRCPAGRSRLLPQRSGIRRPRRAGGAACTTKAATSARACWTAARSAPWSPAWAIAVVGAAFCPRRRPRQSAASAACTACRTVSYGGTYLPGRKVDAIEAGPHGFTVRCGTEHFTAAKLVIAAGLGSRDLAPMVGLHMPVSPLQRPDHRHRAAAPAPRLPDPRHAPDPGRLRDARRQPGGRRLRHLDHQVPVLQEIAARNVADASQP